MSTTNPAPAGSSATPRNPADPEPTVSPPVAYGPVPPPRTGLDDLFAGFWPEGRHTAGRRHVGLVCAALVIALVAASVLPGRGDGLGLWLVVLAGAITVGSTVWRRARPDVRAFAGVFLLLSTMIVLRDAQWAVQWCLLAAYVVATAALCRARSVVGMVVAAVTAPMAWLRGLPWLRRSLPVHRRRLPSWRVLRTVIISGSLLLVFGGLFASADAIFADWVETLSTHLPTTPTELQLTVFGLAAALILGGGYVGLNPPKVERAALGPARSVRRFEWVTPIVAVIKVFVVFLVAQLSALFGGHAYLQRTAGLTYAAYVHQGFGQLTAATAIVLGLVGVTLRYAPRRRPSDRRLVRALIGVLGALALVVVASALFRMQVYEQAYGFTRLRLLVSVFEVWLGLVLLLATTAGVWLRARWVPRVAVVVGVLMIMGMTIANPDAVIAEHNVQRYTTTGRIDLDYLQSLSADAVPALDRLPEPLRSCALRATEIGPTDGLSWNLGRARAEAVLAARPVDPVVSCR